MVSTPIQTIFELERGARLYGQELVIGLITKGIGKQPIDPLVEKRCTWLEMR